MSARTSAPRGSPTPWCAAGGQWDGWRRDPMTDRIVLDGMAFRAIHGVNPEEQVTPQRFEVDVEVALDLGPAGRTDDLARTIDYGRVYDRCRDVVENRR